MNPNEPLSPFEAVALALATHGDVDSVGDAIPQVVWENLHERGLMETRRLIDDDGDTFTTAAGDQALRENCAARSEHYLEKTEQGWAVKHAWSCGPDLLTCEIHVAMLTRHVHAPLEPGRYRISFVGAEVVFVPEEDS